MYKWFTDTINLFSLGTAFEKRTNSKFTEYRPLRSLTSASLLLPIFIPSYPNRKTRSERESDTKSKETLRLFFSLWNFYSTFFSGIEKRFVLCFPQTRNFTEQPLYPSQAQSCVPDKNTKNGLFILFQVCAPFVATDPQKARREEGWKPGSHT